ncbi:MAG: hypothetical protein HZA31_09735 [Opitutae bacterium]|nr:hypothetical protein [Opitutae bacterium]
MRVWQLGVFAVLVFAGAAEIIWLKRHNARLRAEVDVERVRQQELAPLRAENRRLLALAEERARATSPGTSSAPECALQSEAKPAHRNPELGLAPFECFRDVGRGSPTAAFQTTIWAMMQGEGSALAQSFAFAGTARKQAEALLARLPEDTRAKYATPEKMVGVIVFLGMMLGSEGFHIRGQDYDDPTHATVRLLNSHGNADDYAMQLGSVGWQMLVTEKDMRAIELLLTLPLPESARKRLESLR